MGGAQPLAVTMCGGTALVAEVDPARIDKRLATRYLDLRLDGLDAAIDRALAARDAKEAVSIGVRANAVDLLERLLARGIVPDVLTDQTSAHDELNGYVPHGLPYEEALKLRTADPEAYRGRAIASMGAHVRAMLALKRRGAVTFDYGNNLRAGAVQAGVADAFEIVGFVPLYIRPLFCEGKGPFRWAALSGDPADIAATDRAILDLFPENAALRRWITLAGQRVAFQGLPARICWLGYGERAKAGLAFNELVRTGRVKAPIVIGRDHLDCGSVASPNRETEAMRDGSDAIADWPLLNAMLNTAAGATWVSIHHGGGVGIGYSLHAGMVVVADGTDAAAVRLAARPHDGPRDGRDPPRGRGVSRGHRLRREERHPRPDAPLSDRPRRRLALAAGAMAGLALVAAMALRLAPVGGDAVRAREDGFRAGAEQQLERDLADLRRTAERLQASRDFAAIVDGGGAEVRPARLFTLLGNALPPGRGWGAVFFDPAGRPVAWAGDAAGLEAERGAATSGVVVSYHVTRVFVGWVSPRGENGARGTLVVTRRYPTGIIRPDLIEYLGLPGGPSPLRLRLRSAESRDRLFTFFIEPPAPGVAADDVARRRALPAALVLGALAVALGVVARRPVTGLAAARFALLLGMPRGVSELFAPIPPGGSVLGLFSTPADVLLTGLLAAAAAGALARAASASRRLGSAALLAAPLACLPWLAGRWAGSERPGLFEGMSVVPAGAAAFAEQTGLIALSAAGLLAAGALLSRLLPRRRHGAIAALAVAVAGAAFLASGGPIAAPLGLASAVLAAAALAHRAVPSAREDLLARASTAVFVVGAATLLFGAGLADGGRRFVDRALLRAERAAAGDARRVGQRVDRAVGGAGRRPGPRALAARRGPDPQRRPRARPLGARRRRGLPGARRHAHDPQPARGDDVVVRRHASREPRAGRRAARVHPVRVSRRPSCTSRGRASRTGIRSCRGSRRATSRTAWRPSGWSGMRRAGRPARGARASSCRRPFSRRRAAGGRPSAWRTRPTARGGSTSRSAPDGFAGFAAPVNPPLTSAGEAVAAGEAALVLLVPVLFAFRPVPAGPARAAEVLRDVPRAARRARRALRRPAARRERRPRARGAREPRDARDRSSRARPRHGRAPRPPERRGGTRDLSGRGAEPRRGRHRHGSPALPRRHARRRLAGAARFRRRSRASVSRRRSRRASRRGARRPSAARRTSTPGRPPRRRGRRGPLPRRP